MKSFSNKKGSLINRFRLALIFVFVTNLLACSDGSNHQTSVEKTGSEVVANRLVQLEEKASKKNSLVNDQTVKPKPPVSIDYRLLGEPAIGQQLEIELTVTSTLVNTPIEVSYRALNENAMMFVGNTSQTQSFKLPSYSSSKLSNNDNNAGKEIIAVVPQQEGRNYFTVSAQIETEQGIMAVSRSIAIQVGNLPYEKKINGQLVLDSHGEAVISMPASE